MNRALPWIVGVGCLGVALGFILRGRAAPPSASSPAGLATPPAVMQPAQAATPAAPAAQPGEQVAFTFSDQAQMRQFATLMQQRQGLVLRMAVAQDYWNQEQAALGGVDKKLTADYQLDTAKQYALDAERRVLLERAPPSDAAPAVTTAPSDQAATVTPPAPTTPAAPAEPEKIAYTFPDEDSMKAFATTMQQRQAIALRMAVLQDYWRQDQAALATVEQQLTDTYKIDLAKSYSLDTDRRLLIELPQTPASAPAEAAQATPPATQPAL